MGVYKKVFFFFQRALSGDPKKKRVEKKKSLGYLFLFASRIENGGPGEEGGFWSSALKRNKSRTVANKKEHSKNDPAIGVVTCFFFVFTCAAVCTKSGGISISIFFFANLIFNGGVASAFDSVPENLVSFSSSGRH